MDEMVLSPELLTGAFLQAPWLVAAWLAYQLGRKVLADLCKTVPEVLSVLQTFAASAERVSKDGVRVKVDLGEPPPR